MNIQIKIFEKNVVTVVFGNEKYFHRKSTKAYVIKSSKMNSQEVQLFPDRWHFAHCTIGSRDHYSDCYYSKDIYKKSFYKKGILAVLQKQ
jgi:hypothetical protein